MSKNNARRRRDRKIMKLYRKLGGRRDDPKLMRRLLCLQQAEANDILKVNQPPVDLEKVDEKIAQAEELLKRLG